MTAIARPRVRAVRWFVAFVLLAGIGGGAVLGGLWLRERVRGSRPLVETAEGTVEPTVVSPAEGVRAASTQMPDRVNGTLDAGAGGAPGKMSEPAGANEEPAGEGGPAAAAGGDGTAAAVAPTPGVPNTAAGAIQPRISAVLAAFSSPDTAPTASNVAWNAPVRSVVELQPYRESQTVTNARGDRITLTNLNPFVGAFYLLDVEIGGKQLTFELETPCVKADPSRRPKLTLTRDGLAVAAPRGTTKQFALWPDSSAPLAPALAADGKAVTPPTSLGENPVLAADIQTASHASAPYTAICDGSVLVRTQKGGSATLMESTTDLLREAPLGEWFVEALKPYLIPKPEMASEGGTAANAPLTVGGPRAAAVDASFETATCSPTSLAIANDAPDKKFQYGHWYGAVNHPGVYVSVMKASVAGKEILESYTDRVSKLGARGAGEADALVYIEAIDTSRFRFGFALGAEHPGVEWSPNSQAPRDTPGPDGFEKKAPLVTIGSIPPYEAPYVEATFTGGFKRHHGAFKLGPLSKENRGNHFGFAERGVVFSRLMPGLATACVGVDGSINLVTWPQEVKKLPPQIMDARQNCVAIIEGTDANGVSVPGAWVNEWGPGAWSGSQAGNFLTTRSGLGIQEFNGKTYLMVAYFTGATPNAMARVFQAYHCRYAMLLDMNSLSYCYAALYLRDEKGNVSGAEYLHRDMASANGSRGALRFLQTDDTRDFFYVTRVPQEQQTAMLNVSR